MRQHLKTRKKEYILNENMKNTSVSGALQVKVDRLISRTHRFGLWSCKVQEATCLM